MYTFIQLFTRPSCPISQRSFLETACGAVLFSLSTIITLTTPGITFSYIAWIDLLPCFTGEYLTNQLCLKSFAVKVVQLLLLSSKMFSCVGVSSIASPCTGAGEVSSLSWKPSNPQLQICSEVGLLYHKACEQLPRL